MSAHGQPRPTVRKRYPTECTTCRGPVEEGFVSLMLPPMAEGGARIISGVPAGVCRQCGEQFFDATTMQQVEKVLTLPPSREEKVPVWEFASSA